MEISRPGMSKRARSLDDASLTGNLGAPVRFSLDDHEAEDRPYLSENPLLSGLRDTTLRMQKRDSEYEEFDIPSVIDIKREYP